MSNTLEKFKKYTTKLDEVFQLASLTAVLEGDNSLVQMGANTEEFLIPKISMDGLADYSRANGYVGGDITLEMETRKCNYERGRSFNVDAMDNEETAGVAFGYLASEFLRTKVAPEADAFRFAKYAGATGISKVASGATLSTGAEVIAALAAAMDGMDNDEVPQEMRYLFITPALAGLIRDMDTTKSREIMSSFAGVQKVPQGRFYTAIDLYDGTTEDEEAGGYVKASGGKDINFMVIYKPAVMQYTKHIVNKVITPAENQMSDAWKFFYRANGLANVYDNKVKGIYLHHKAS